MFHQGLSWVTSYSLWKASPALTVRPIHASFLPQAAAHCLIKASADVIVDQTEDCSSFFEMANIIES